MTFQFFFFNDTATTEIYTLSLHDALPISFHQLAHPADEVRRDEPVLPRQCHRMAGVVDHRSEEHTSELQSQSNLVCRLLLEKKKNKKTRETIIDKVMMEQKVAQHLHSARA